MAELTRVNYRLDSGGHCLTTQAFHIQSNNLCDDWEARPASGLQTGALRCRKQSQGCRHLSRTKHRLKCPFLLMNIDTNESEDCHHAAQLQIAVCQSARIEASSPAQDLEC
jgi:hypothetical protein